MNISQTKAQATLPHTKAQHHHASLEALHTMQRKKACLRSGMIWLVRITIPRSATIWSMCCGSRFLSGFTSRRLYVRTCHVKSYQTRDRLSIGLPGEV